MPAKSNPDSDLAGKTLVISRVFDAPRQLVFKAWTDPKHLEQWWGPAGFTNPRCEADARAGGAIRIDMRGPDGTVYPMSGTFREVVDPERLVFDSSALDKAGKPLFTVQTSVTFAEKAGKTQLKMIAKVLSATPGAARHIAGMDAGWNQSLDRFAAHLPSKLEPLVIERTLDAPVARVWQALTTADAIRKWSFDLKDFRAEPGFEFQMDKVKDEVRFLHLCRVVEAVPERKLSYTWRYDGHAGDSLVTFELFPEGSRTRVRLTHTGLDSFPKIPDLAKHNFMDGWTQIVGSFLRHYVEKDSGAAAVVEPGSDREIAVSRVFDAPRERVWDAWTDPKKVVRWWGPRGFTTTIETMDVRPGGSWIHTMHGPDGTAYPNASTFLEVVKPERIVFAHGGAKKGGPPAQFVATWTFEDLGEGKTRLTVRMVFPTAAARDEVVRVYGALEGAKQTLARLDEFLPSGP